MNTDKLNEALVELRHQRALLDTAISNIESVLKTLQTSSGEVHPANGKKREGSYIDLGVQILEESGKPLHIKEIARKISAIRGKNIARASVESSFIRHITTFGNHARVVKVQPAIFTVPSLKHAINSPPLVPVSELGRVKSA